MYTENELFFPHYIIPSLAELRGSKWQALVERIAKLPEKHEETIAFMQMMVDLNGCLSCETDSYRAMRGCAPCTYQTIRRYRGTDDELLAAFQDALMKVRQFANNNQRVGSQIQNHIVDYN